MPCLPAPRAGRAACPALDAETRVSPARPRPWKPPRRHAGRGEGLTRALGPGPRVLPGWSARWPRRGLRGGGPAAIDSRTKGRASAQAQSAAARGPAPPPAPAPCLPRGRGPSATQGSCAADLPGGQTSSSFSGNSILVFHFQATLRSKVV